MLNLQNRNEFYYYFLPTQTRIEPLIELQEKWVTKKRSKSGQCQVKYLPPLTKRNVNVNYNYYIKEKHIEELADERNQEKKRMIH